MKKALTYLFLFFLISCSSEDKSKPIENQEKQVEKDHQSFEEEQREKAKCTFSKNTLKTLKNTPPFDKNIRVEAIVFDFEAVVKEHKEYRKKGIKNRLDTTDKCTAISNGQVVLSHIKERRFLSEPEINKLFEVLIYNKGETYLYGKCYHPNHVFVFYDGYKAIGFLELCFSCKVYMQEGCNFDEFCYKKWVSLSKFFNDTSHFFNN